MTDRYLIVANFQHGTKIVADGAKAFVLWTPGSPDRCCVVVRSRGGRWIEKWEQTKNLGNLRIKTVVEQGCPAKAWRWASERREDLDDQLQRLKAERDIARTIDRDRGDEDARS